MTSPSISPYWISRIPTFLVRRMTLERTTRMLLFVDEIHWLAMLSKLNARRNWRNSEDKSWNSSFEERMTCCRNIVRPPGSCSWWSQKSVLLYPFILQFLSSTNMSSFAVYPISSYRSIDCLFLHLKLRGFCVDRTLSLWKPLIFWRNSVTILSFWICQMTWKAAKIWSRKDSEELVQVEETEVAISLWDATGVENSSFWKGRFLRRCILHDGTHRVICRFLYHIHTQTNDKIVLISNYTQTLDLFEKLCRNKKCGPSHMCLLAAADFRF